MSSVVLAAMAVILLPFAVLLPFIGPTAQAQASGTTVNMVDFKFDPIRLEVPLGSTVTWVYKDTQCDLIPPCPGHDSRAEVKGPDGEPLWKTETIKGQGKTVAATMTQLGEISYICTIHAGPPANMRATIVVVSAATPAPAPGPSTTPTSASGGSTTTGRTLPATGGSVPLGVSGVAAVLAAWALRVLTRPAHARR
ncbi:MAG: hypothetical protein QOC92_1159 [Acidimicrobiaceae bacterium]